jgi:hypothetical protein
MKLNLLKKLLSVTLITIFLLGFNVIPADANGCYTVTSGVLSSGSSCTGDVVIDNSVTSIGISAFENNSRITSVTIGNSVTTIGDHAFEDNTSLTSVTIGSSVTTIGYSAFYYSSLTSVTIPNSVTEIGDSAFQDNYLLASVTIGSSVTTIGAYAFEYSALTSVTIPNSVTTIGQGAFADSALASVTFLGNAPTTVGANAFIDIADGAKANVAYNATGFPAQGGLWNGLIVTYGSAPSEDSDSSSPSVITPVVEEAPDAVFNLKNKKYLSKYAMKIELRKNRSFKRNPEDLYKYEIFKSSKKTCTIIGNYVTRLKKTGTCDFYATRTTAKGKKYKYWVQINYTK